MSGHCPDAAELTGAASVSVFAADTDDTTLEDLLGDAYIPHESIRVSTARRVRAAGFTIRRTGRYPHCSVELGAESSLEIARALAGAFDPPQPNPSLRHQL